MSSNTEWQRQQVNERVQSALREGLAVRRVQQRRKSGRRVPFPVKAALALGAAWFFLGVVLAGCTPVDTARASSPQTVPVITMADRIAFQDRVWEASHPPADAQGDLTGYSLADASAYRWKAMAEYYAEKAAAADLRTLSAADASACRWRAMAEFYAKKAAGAGVDLRTLSADDVMAYRWIAMGRFYAEYVPAE